MKLGLGIPLTFTQGARDPWYKVNEEAQFVEDLGFAFTTAGHHSFTPGFESSSPLISLTWLAARSTRLKLVTGILILPLHDPVAVAEQVAMLDSLSGGRIILGVGAGYRDYEFEGYRIDAKSRGRRMNESIEILRGAFETGFFEYSGEFFEIPKLPLVPAPDSPPPIWVGGTSPPALKRAGTLGDGWMTENMSPVETMRAYAETYRGHCAEAGRLVGNIVLYRNCYLAPTRAQVEEEFIPGYLQEHLAYRAAGAVKNVADEQDFYGRAARGEKIALDEVTDGRAIAGTPDDVIAQIKRWEQEIGATHLNLMGVGPENGEDEWRKTLELWGREVIPYI